MPQFVKCRFGPLDKRLYTYANEGAAVAVGDFVKVADRSGEGWKKVEVMEVTDEVPPFACKPILGKLEPEPAPEPELGSWNDQDEGGTA